MKRIGKLLVFLLYIVFAAVFCILHYFLYTDSFETPIPYERDVSLSAPEEPIFLELNTASAAQLAKLPGISRPLAEQIVAYREEIGGFTSLQQLRDVSAVPESLYDTLGEYLYLEPTEETQAAAETATEAETALTLSAETETMTEPLLDLNTATAEELCLLPGIGEETAHAIVSYRAQIGGFRNRRQLLAVAGIGETTLARISEHLYLPDEEPLPTTEPTEPSVTEAVSEASSEPAEIPMVNLNTATFETLLLLPNCTEELAHSVIALREGIHEFRNILELLYAEGMTPEIYREWRDYVTVDDAGNTELPKETT